jgi:Ca2+-transporting ATPase
MNNGLTDEQVLQSRGLHGSNALELEEDRVFLTTLREVVTEPMFILLAVACAIYFITGKTQEGIIMAVSICLVAGISLFQEYRSRNAIRALNKLSATKAVVMRNGIATTILAEDIVVDDLLIVEEGNLIAADGLIVEARDFSVNESVLTGESFGVFKSADNKSSCYKGTLVVSGKATVRVVAIGAKTMFGKIGMSVKEITVVKTPLQLQIRAFVRNMVWIGAIAFLIVVGFNYFHSHNLVNSFLQGLTLAMSILPEEIPVAFSAFQAIGAFRLLKNQIIVKQPQYVETLGAATVICADKTGTLTQNKMQIDHVFDWATRTSIAVAENGAIPLELIEYAMWSSETEPFDPMEKAIHALYGRIAPEDLRGRFQQVHEYPISGTPPKMTHLFSNGSGTTIIAAKGGQEGILRQSHLTVADMKTVEEQALAYAKQGYRVLGVGKGIWTGEAWPKAQEEFNYAFLGLIAFQDPPKENMKDTIRTFHDAGISVKMITGDYPETAIAIADQVGLDHNHEVLTGKEVLHMDIPSLQRRIGDVSIFARMFPEAKLKVINALRENGEVVAMTGDGVNDAPALKAAHIGIAMGQRGSEVAKGAASLIIADDDLSHMTEAVALGRKIYDNLKKAIRYIVSIHIPIILIVAVPLLLGWAYPNLFSPVHVIFLELIMGPTCSIIYENEPMEPGTMLRPPRKIESTFLSFRQLSISMLQGFVIAAGCLGLGYLAMREGRDEKTVRSLVFITLLFCNILLTLVNRSFTESIFRTIRYKNRLIPLISGINLAFIAALLTIPFLQELFELHPLSYMEIGSCLATGVLATCWIDLVKAFQVK